MTEAASKSERTPRRRIFNPLRLKDEEVEQSFIARRALFESILNDVAAENAARSPQHHLIVGQRGMGKTLLLCRLAAELRKADYRTRFLPLTFPEEQYIEVDRLSRFWLNCLDAMADSLEALGEHETARELDAEVARLDRAGKNEDALAEQTRARFQSAIDRLGRRPVLLVDNLHLLLKRLRKHDYVLRGFFTRRGAAVLVGTATIVPEQMQDYGAAFYDAFKTHVLHRLSLAEMREVIAELARQADRPDVARRLQREMPRLRVLRELTGGNPRTTVLLFDLFARGFSDDPYEDLECLLDEVTPLYQSRLDQLAEQGQMIFSALARHWSPATAAEVAGLTGFPRGSISPQLGRLEEIGLVEKAAIFPGKKTGYQIAERFFNVWYLMRFGSRRQRSGLVCLTRFLEAFYTSAELAARARCVLGKTELRSGEAVYALALAETLRGDGLGHDLRTHAELAILRHAEGIRERIAEIIDPADISPQSLSFDEQRRKLRSLVPEDSPVPPDEFADVILGAISLVPPGAAFDRRTIAASGELSRKQVKAVISLGKKDREAFSYLYTDEAVAFVQDRLRRGSLMAWDDREGLRAAIDQAPTGDSAMLLGDLAGREGACADEAEHAYHKACELDPESAVPWNNLGNLLQDHLARYDEAEQAYRKACELDPEFAAAWYNLGNLLQDHLGRFDEAEQAYRRACELDPKDARPWNNLGDLLQDHLGRYDEAEQAYHKACELDPKSAVPWNNLGNLLQDHLARYDEAEQAYRKAYELEPQFAAAWYNLGNLLQDHLGRFDEAEQAYRKACELDPKLGGAWTNLGNLLQEHLGRYDEAEQAYRKACDLEPKSAAPWNNLGNLLHYHLARYDEAEQAYRKACELDPESALPWNNLGNLLKNYLGRYDEAEHAYRKACELDPKLAWAWNGLGNLLMDCLGRHDEAREAFERALEVSPGEDLPRHNLAFLLRDLLQQPDAAREAVSELKEPGRWKDTQALHKALFAAYEGNWGIACDSLRTALAETGKGLPTATRDDWYRSAAVIVHLGFGEKLVELLQEEEADVRLRPWFEAVRAHVLGDERHLRNIPAEAQDAARQIYAAIDRWKKQLPKQRTQSAEH